MNKSAWIKVPIGEVAQVISGSTPRTTIKEYWDGGDIVWLTPADLTNEDQRVFDSGRKITRSGLEGASITLVPKGTVLLTSRAPIGKVAIAGTELCTNQGFKNIVCSELLDNEYLFYYLRGKTEFLNGLGRGATFKEISKTIVEGIEVPLPPIETQRKIAGILNQAKGLIDKRNEQIEILDEFLQSVFFEIIGDPLTNPYEWDAKPLSELAEITMGQSPRGTSYNEDGFGVPLLNGPTEFGERHPVEKQWTTEPTRLCEENDILFCVRGATAGRLNYADKEYCIGRGLASIRPYNIDHTSLVYAVLEHLYDHFQDTSDGSTFANINRGRIGEVTIPIVDSERLSKFIDISRQTDRQKELMKKGLIEMENNFNSLMQRAFRGELFS